MLVQSKHPGFESRLPSKTHLSGSSPALIKNYRNFVGARLRAGGQSQLPKCLAELLGLNRNPELVDSGLNLGPFDLPDGFWKNVHKVYICSRSVSLVGGTLRFFYSVFGLVVSFFFWKELFVS